MRGHGEKLSRKRTAAIVALLSQPTIADAAKACGIGEATLWRWLQQPEFSEQYREARARMLDGAISRLSQISTDAVTTLHVVAKNKRASPSSRVSAARAILEIALKAAEIEDVRRELEELKTNLGVGERPTE